MFKPGRLMKKQRKRTFCKRKEEGHEQNIRRHFYKENEDPGTSHNLLQMRRRTENSLTSTRVPLNFMDGNGGCSLVGQSIGNFFPKLFKGHSPVNKLQCSFDVAHHGDEQENNENLQKERNKSVCLIYVIQNGRDMVTQGTGFVFVDNVIQTNCHYFRPYLVENKLMENVSVSVVFNYDYPEQKENHLCFTAENILVSRDDRHDAVFLQLKPADMAVPPGLVRHIAPQPESGVICIAGYPDAGWKRSESTQIIAPGNRRKVVEDHLAQFIGQPYKYHYIDQTLKNKDIEQIMGGEFTDKVVTYHSSMFEGASGSPVFIGGKVVAMHTGGYDYEWEEKRTIVMAYGVDQLAITSSLVRKLKQSGNVEMLERLKLEARFNKYLSQILEFELTEVN